jgi:hypothetical protein
MLVDLAENDESGGVDNGDDNDDANGDQLSLAASEAGSLKRASKEIATEKTTKNTKQRRKRGPCKNKSQSKPKMIVERETKQKDVFLHACSTKSYAEGVLRLKEPSPSSWSGDK